MNIQIAMVRKLVVAVDDSAVSKDTLHWAAEKLLRPDDELHIISVLEPASGGNFAATAETAYPVSMQEVGRAGRSRAVGYGAG